MTIRNPPEKLSDWVVSYRLKLLAGNVRAIGIGGTVAVLPSHTTVHAGPHTAVRRVELCVNSQAFCIVRRQETIRSLPGGPLGASPLLAAGRPNNIGFLPRIVPEIALLICRSLYSPCGVPFGPSVIVPGSVYLSS